MMTTPTAAACPPAEWVEWICRIEEPACRDCQKPATPLLQKVAQSSRLRRNSLKKPRFVRGFFYARDGCRSQVVGFSACPARSRLRAYDGNSVFALCLAQRRSASAARVLRRYSER